MNAAVSPHPLEILLMILLGGGFGTPSGLPPTAEDPLAAQVAPADCLFYASWAGTGTPDPASGNHTEQLLAEPEVRAFLARVQPGALEAFLHGPAGGPGQPQDDAVKLLELVQGKPGAVYLSELTFGGNGAPAFKGGGLLRLGDDAAEVQALLEKLQDRLPKEQLSQVQIASRPCTRIRFEDSALTVTWAIADGYLFVGVGDGSLDALLERAGGETLVPLSRRGRGVRGEGGWNPPWLATVSDELSDGRQRPPSPPIPLPPRGRGETPQWLTALRAKLAVPRVSSTIYVDVRRLVELAVAQSGSPEGARVVAAAGFDKITSLSVVSGLDDQGSVCRALLAVEGKATGLLAWIDSQPIEAGDLQGIGDDAPIAVALKLHPAWLLDTWIAIAAQVEPRAAEEIREGIAEMNREFGFDLRKDLIESLGDTWTLVAQPNADALPLALAVDIRDREKLERVRASFVQFVNSIAQQFGPGGPSLTENTVAGHTVHTMTVPDPSFPFAPSFCMTEDRLLVAAAPAALERLLAGRAGGRSLAEREEVAELVADDARTLMLAYVDARAVAPKLLPLATAWLQSFGPGMPPLDGAGLPRAETVLRHLRPSLIAVARSEEGVTFLSRQTLPGINVGTSVPTLVALAVPAVAASREAARRAQSVNNLKMILLALHNYHDVNGAFPAGYSADAGGKPLLSWRVYILPFVEQQQLYQRFHLDEPWDSPHNKALIEPMPAVFRSPGAKCEPGKTNYLGVSGADGIFVRPRPGAESPVPVGTSMVHITDGTSNTLAVVEVPDESAVIWTRPGDFAPNKENPARGLFGLYLGGTNVAMTDGSVRFIAETIAREVLRALFTKSGGEAVAVP